MQPCMQLRRRRNTGERESEIQNYIHSSATGIMADRFPDGLLAFANERSRGAPWLPPCPVRPVGPSTILVGFGFEYG